MSSGGTKTRSRSCNPPQNGGRQCPGSSVETKYCSTNSCNKHKVLVVTTSKTVDLSDWDVDQVKVFAIGGGGTRGEGNVSNISNNFVSVLVVKKCQAITPTLFQYGMGGGGGSGYLGFGQIRLSGDKKLYVSIGKGSRSKKKNGGHTTVSNSDGDKVMNRQISSVLIFEKFPQIFSFFL